MRDRGSSPIRCGGRRPVAFRRASSACRRRDSGSPPSRTRRGCRTRARRRRRAARLASRRAPVPPLPRRRSTPSPRRTRRAATGRSSLAAVRRTAARAARSPPCGRPAAPRAFRSAPPSRASRVRRVPDEHPERDDDGSGRDERPSGGPHRAARGDPPEHRGRDRAGADGGEQLHPADARVAAGAERVDERDRPRGVREPVHRAPRPQPSRARSRLVTVSASRRSNATVPSPSQIGRYGDANGMTASFSPIGAKLSATVVSTWTATKTIASSVRLRCRPATTKRGSASSASGSRR